MLSPSQCGSLCSRRKHQDGANVSDDFGSSGGDLPTATSGQMCAKTDPALKWQLAPAATVWPAATTATIKLNELLWIANR